MKGDRAFWIDFDNRLITVSFTGLLKELKEPTGILNLLTSLCNRTDINKCLIISEDNEETLVSRDLKAIATIMEELEQYCDVELEVY